MFSKCYIVYAYTESFAYNAVRRTHTKLCPRQISYVLPMCYFRLQTHSWTHTHNAWIPHCQLNVSAAALILFMALIAMGGLKQSSLVNTVTMFIKFGVLVFFLIYGFINFHPEYLTPLFPYQAEGVFRVCMPCMHVTRVWHYCIHTFGHKAVLICVAISYARLLPFSIQS